MSSGTEVVSVEAKRPPLWYFIDPSQPWILGGGERAIFDNGAFDLFIPPSYRYGPWHWAAIAALSVLTYLLIIGATWMNMNRPNGGWMSLFVIGEDQYSPFSVDWYLTTIAFLWTAFLFVRLMRLDSIFGKMARISFTFWSWSTMMLRHGLLVVSPWVPAARVPAEILRLPVLLSACLTFGLWNLVIFPAILVFYIKNAEGRKSFTADFLSFNMINLHVCNIFFAVSNAATLQPLRPLHLGDLAAAFAMLMLYAAYYLLILDRLGVHLYPILSPRSLICIPSLILILAIWFGGYLYWKENFLPRDVLVHYVQSLMGTTEYYINNYVV